MVDLGKWEWCVSAVSKREMEMVGLSWVFSVDCQYLRDMGCVMRLVAWGRTLEVYKPMPNSIAENREGI